MDKTALAHAICTAQQLEKQDEEKRNRWVQLRDGKGQAGMEEDENTALQEYRQAQREHEAAMDTIVDPTGRTGLIPELREAGLLIAALVLLDEGQREYLTSLLRHLRLEALLENPAEENDDGKRSLDGYEEADGFVERVAAWVRAMHLADAMQQIWEIRRDSPANFEAALEANVERLAANDASTDALDFYRQELQKVTETDEQLAETAATAVAYELYLQLRRRLTCLNEDMRQELIHRRKAFAFIAELHSLPAEHIRIVQVFMDQAVPEPLPLPLPQAAPAPARARTRARFM